MSFRWVTRVRFVLLFSIRVSIKKLLQARFQTYSEKLCAEIINAACVNTLYFHGDAFST